VLNQRFNSIKPQYNVQDPEEREPLIFNQYNSKEFSEEVPQRNYNTNSDNSGAISSYSIFSMPDFFSSCWNYISFFWIEFRKLISTSHAAAPIDPVVKQRMTDFQTHISIPFNNEDPTHHEELVKLWNLFFPQEHFTLQSSLWKKLGFQSDNPLTDFRASGFFGLKNLLFFAEKYPAKFQWLVDLQEKRQGEYYPFAIASFNVTMMICELLGWGWKKPGVSTAKDPVVYRKLLAMLFSDNYSIAYTENIFLELYCLAMVETDREWTESKATYMDFPVVIANSQQRLEKHILGFNGVESLVQHNQLMLNQ